MVEVIPVYLLALVFGIGASITIGKRANGWVRIIGGGVGGAGSAVILEYGGAYSYFASAYYGGMGLMGYLFIGSFCFLCFVWIFNLMETGDRLIR